ncbi:unnamed protein product [Microthlaspi erraticum]|uniref:NB-ARC domain-containing protein n=1 Tax=Microthlaspi erraticum TaxID=1685480 RepID=A0A6D2JAH0_9BRAS|nr:unnamed protein product [Microthlaspi erraticum]
MGNPFSISLDPCVNKVSSWINEKVGYIHNLENNLVTLETTMEELRAKRDDLLTRVTREEDRGHQRLGEIKVWLKRVETTEKKVNDLLSARDDELQRLCLCGFCSKSLRLRSSCRYGKKVFLTLTDVKELSCRVFEVIVEQSQTLEVQERQLQPIIVGQETMLDKAWKHLKEDEVGIMGMYGMGGVGKTTLLMQINNKFSEERCGFDFVIWVVVSKELHVEKIQDEIAQKIDDIWEKVDLTEIGVPFPTTQNGCKVVFTTRSQEALNVIGETMSCKRTVEEWRSTIAELTRYATEFADMKDKILPLLKYSYDNLKEEHVKSCIERAENKGYEIIGDLVRASLLMEEEAEKDGTRRVRMHDVVREMALWIASELGKEKEAFIVHAGAWLTEIPKVNNWKTVRRMSLMQNRIRNLAGSPECLELKTFLMQWGFLENISSEFFKSMPS